MPVWRGRAPLARVRRFIGKAGGPAGCVNNGAAAAVPGGTGPLDEDGRRPCLTGRARPSR